MEGDAIGGTMNLVMKQAPSNFLLSANVAGVLAPPCSPTGPSAPSTTRVSTSNHPPNNIGNSYNATAANFPLSELHYHNVANPINGTAGITVGDRFAQQKLGVLYFRRLPEFLPRISNPCNS